MESSPVLYAQTQKNALLAHIPSTRVAIVESVRCFAELLVHLCDEHWKLPVVSLTHCGPTAIQEIIAVRPDLILINLCLGGDDATVLIQKINAALPEARIIIISAEYRDYHLYRLTRSEIHGFVDTTMEGLLGIRLAIDRVQQGATSFSTSYLKKSRALRISPRAFYRLFSEREQEVLSLISQSLSDEEVADQLGISAATAQTHRRAIMRKANVHSTPKLIRYALNLGLVATSSVANTRES